MDLALFFFAKRVLAALVKDCLAFTGELRFDELTRSKHHEP